MSRRFISLVLAAAVTITGFGAAPARAASQEEQVVGALAGLTALFIVGKALEGRDDDDSKKRHHAAPPPKRHHAAPRVARDRNKSRHRNARPFRQHDDGRDAFGFKRKDRFLPARCIRRHETRRGVVRVMGNRCLQRHYRQAGNLPRDCQVKLRTQKGKRRGYRIGCLRQRGFSVAR